mgnify:CR=1 FL=1
MKIAICIYGLPRGSKKVWNQIIKNIVIPLNADIYVHTWRGIVGGSTHHGTDSSTFKPISSLAKFWLKNPNIEIKSFKVEEQKASRIKTMETRWGKVYVSHQHNTWKTITQSCNGLDTSQYDWICFTRFDALVESKLNNIEQIIAKYDLFHFGHKNQDDIRYDAEDVLFFLKSNFLELIPIIKKKIDKNYYAKNDIYNVILHEAQLLGLRTGWAGKYDLKLAKIYRPFFKNIFEKIKKRIKLLIR